MLWLRCRRVIVLATSRIARARPPKVPTTSRFSRGDPSNNPGVSVMDWTGADHACRLVRMEARQVVLGALYERHQHLQYIRRKWLNDRNKGL